jgi:hypothetical protein
VTTRTLARAQADLEYALGQGGALIERSTFGSMLERVLLYACDEHGKPIPPPPDDAIRIKHHHGEPGYDLDFSTLARIGRAHRLLDAVGSGQNGRLLRAVLEAYHGDRGARWARPFKADLSGGVGDRDVAIYPLTEMGRRWVRELRKRYPLSGALRADEVLANEFSLLKTGPNDDMRRMRLRHCAVQARGLLEEASRVLEVAAIEADTTRRQIRAATLAAERGQTKAANDILESIRGGSRVIVRTATGRVLHGPFEALSAEAWNDVHRGCLLEVVA